MRVLIKHAAINKRCQDILIVDGKIEKIARGIEVPADEEINAHGAAAIPGLIDVHVHFREPGLTYKETIETGSHAAAHGGFTTVMTMPNVKPVVDTAEKVRQQVLLNQENSLVKIAQFGALSADLVGVGAADLQAMADAGAMAFSNDGHGVQDAQTMLEAMKAAKQADRVISAHLEDDSLIQGGVMNAGPEAERLGLPGMTGLSESTQLARDLVMAQATGVKYHIAHISTKESVAQVRLAKQMGLSVTAEVSPHHLFLDDSMIETDDPMFKMNPPLRSKEDRLALIAGLLDGTIDMIATDHAPHSEEEKSGSMHDCSFGIVGLETALPLVYTHFVKSGLVDLDTVLDWMVRRPKQVFNLASAGELRVGDAADIALVDFIHPYKITPEEFESKGKNTPFTGQEVYGKVLKTLVDGHLVYQAKKE
ncbi:amidohydrolase family protein [Fructobacillus tropaeoli]|uniref:dihydroorotase n=1 Tax=Fructobacillus tropaeoli TaxID=709323 RepID=UPI001455E53F|nr:dihydroorotase [Fructobacillus tropaeoli]NLS37495.1 amidohydrolase family protein [Fructobacillus tropaeoli]